MDFFCQGPGDRRAGVRGQIAYLNPIKKANLHLSLRQSCIEKVGHIININKAVLASRDTAVESKPRELFA